MQEMYYPYPVLTDQLQFYCESNEYQEVSTKYTTSLGTLRAFNIGSDFFQLLPVYRYAQCPICGTSIESPVDTYSPLGIGLGVKQILDVLYTPARHLKGFPKNCTHFLGIHRFFNLHNMQRFLTHSFDNKTGEIPYITTWCLPDDLQSYAIIHALPICRIDGNQFIPTFSVFSLTYFCENPNQLMKRKLDTEWIRGQEDPEFWPNVEFDPPYFDHSTNRFYDLQYWADRGLLGYLDITQKELPLRISQGIQLPAIYCDIQGIPHRYTWRNGKVEFLK